MHSRQTGRTLWSLQNYQQRALPFIILLFSCWLNNSLPNEKPIKTHRSFSYLFNMIHFSRFYTWFVASRSTTDHSNLFFCYNNCKISEVVSLLHWYQHSNFSLSILLDETKDSFLYQMDVVHWSPPFFCTILHHFSCL